MNNALVSLGAPAKRRPPYPWHLVETIRLRDGAPVTIRPIRAADLRLQRAFVIGLSAQTRYQRLLSGRKLLPGELKRMTDIDYDHEMALAATATVDGAEQILGVARYVRDDEHGPGSADFALVIGDRWQGQGLGETLLRRLLRVAADRGVSVLTGITLSSNARMIALARKLGFRTARAVGDVTVTEVRRELHDGSELAEPRDEVHDEFGMPPPAAAAVDAYLWGIGRW
jgi:RimJ/RimL family protein N-acetyltransferase